MKKLLTCDVLLLGRIFNEGVWIKPDALSEPVFYDFDMGPVIGKQMHFGTDDNCVWFMAYNHMIKLDEQNKTWWFDYDKWDKE